MFDLHPNLRATHPVRRPFSFGPLFYLLEPP